MDGDNNKPTETSPLLGAHRDAGPSHGSIASRRSSSNWSTQSPPQSAGGEAATTGGHHLYHHDPDHGHDDPDMELPDEHELDLPDAASISTATPSVYHHPPPPRAAATTIAVAFAPHRPPASSPPPPTSPTPPLLPPIADLPVYTNIHRIRRDIVSVVEDYISPEQLRDVRLNLAVVRPLVDKLYDLDDISIVYCLLVNRSQFLLEESAHTNRHNVHHTRATLCELIATRILRRFADRAADDDAAAGADSPAGLLLLAHVLVAGFSPFQNAPDDVREQAARMHRSTVWAAHHHRGLPALEIAILTEAKFFLSSTACQRIVHAIYEGRIVYTPTSFLELIPDHYKQKPIQLYDPRDAPLLNQYRLIVPRTRNALEIAHFVVLLGLYMLVMAESGSRRDADGVGVHMTKLEALFALYSFGWALDQFSTVMSHGWHVYTQNLWSFLDVGFAVIYLVYLVLRVDGWRSGADAPAQQAFDVLALGALVLVPRLAFNLLSDNLVFLSLRSMMSDFSLLTALSAWCFFGFLLSLYWLGDGSHMPVTISKWMLWIWFGLDGTGIQRSGDFHWLLGPSVMIAFAFLGNTLFLTILVSMLTNTFSNIAANATAEICYRRAVLTLETVKSDALFAYMPPFNIVAVFVFFPLKFVLSPRWFHKIHVTAVRFVNLPLLLLIAIAERRLLSSDHHHHRRHGVHEGGHAESQAAAAPPPFGGAKHSHTGSSSIAPHYRQREQWWSWFWPEWSSHRDIRSVFDLPPPEEVHDEIAVDDELTHHLIRRQFTRTSTADMAAIPRLAPPPSRPAAADSHGDSQDHSGGTASSTAPPSPRLRQRGGVPGGRRPNNAIPKSRRDSMFPGITSQALRESFVNDTDDAPARGGA
jgi:hypothetical protein